MEIEELLVQIAKILDSLKIQYVITGGMAVSVWGRPRSTADIDIIIELLPLNIGLLSKKLLKVDKDIYISEDAIKEALERKGEFNFIHPQSGLKVDFWIVKDSFNRNELKRAVPQEFEGYKVNFVSPEDLILSKLLWFKESNSTKQLEDIKSVLDITKIDLDYIKKWAVKQNTIKELNNLLKKDGVSQ
ncbi:MAG: nucleotidyl transferase AbiEii/AbiGii toxin family protein [Patescibacteria group bacterium]